MVAMTDPNSKTSRLGLGSELITVSINSLSMRLQVVMSGGSLGGPLLRALRINSSVMYFGSGCIGRVFFEVYNGRVYFFQYFNQGIVLLNRKFHNLLLGYGHAVDLNEVVLLIFY